MKKAIFIFIIFVKLTLPVSAQSSFGEWVACNPQGCKLFDPYYEEGVTFQWNGACVNGKANGNGIALKYEDSKLQSTYTGEYVNGIRKGNGTYINHLSNETWEGNFIDGQLSGFAKYKREDGSRYEGNFINYTQHGKGTYYYANGSKFDGLFKSFTLYTGIYTYPNGEKKYLYRGALSDKKITFESNYSPKLNQEITEYFTKDWERCDASKAAYYRRITYSAPNIPKGKIVDYYINGQKQSEFYALYIDYTDDQLNFHVGEAKWYHTNGKLSRVCNYYLQNRIEGLNINYYDNGNKESEIFYAQGVLDGIYKTYYKTGKPKIYAQYENNSLVDNKYIEYDETGLGALVYNEDFRANKEEWEIDLDGSSSELTEDGKISLNINSDIKTSRYNYITLDQNSSYSIESIVQKKTGKGNEGYGLMFGFKDWNNYFQFLISEYGSFIILSEFEGVNIKISEWTKSTAINVGNKRNLLKVMKFDDEFIFSINGEVVKRVKSKDLRGNNIGIIAGGKGDYVLENIIVKEFLSNEELEKRGPKNVSANTAEWKGNGTGFFINEKGYIATNYHVIEDAKTIQVEYFQKGIKNTFLAKVIVTDKQNDLAILQINDAKFKSLPTIPYVFSSNIRDVGSDVFALGYPIADVMGNEIKFTDGRISSKTGIKGDITVYQISVPIQPGNSGGPLFDSKGNLVGITSSGLNKEYFNSENVNYAIKTTYLKNLIDVMPENITLPNYTDIFNKPLTEKIKLISDFTPIIRVK